MLVLNFSLLYHWWYHKVSNKMQFVHCTLPVVTFSAMLMELVWPTKAVHQSTIFRHIGVMTTGVSITDCGKPVDDMGISTSYWQHSSQLPPQAVFSVLSNWSNDLQFHVLCMSVEPLLHLTNFCWKWLSSKRLNDLASVHDSVWMMV